MTVDGVETRYYYNGLNQLETAVTGDTQVSYTYDGMGNQIKEETAEISGEEGSEVITVTESVDTEYTLTGEMTSLTKTEGSVETLVQTNVYNHNGQRISRNQDGTTRSYYYDSGVVVFTEDGSSVSSANILTVDGAAIGTYRGSTYYVYLKDLQGSTTNLVKEDGTLSASYDYTDFGETTEITGEAIDNQICYTGGIYDEETGLYYLNARYYNPETGRFISQDTYRGELNNPTQWHLYAYCANNPIKYIDPSGCYVVSMGSRFEVSGFIGLYTMISINAGKTYVSCTTTKGVKFSASIQVSFSLFITTYWNKVVSDLPGWGMSSGFSFSTPIGGLSVSGGVDVLSNGELAVFGTAEYGTSIGISISSAYIEIGYTTQHGKYKKTKMSKTEKTFKANGKKIKRKAMDDYVRFRYVGRKTEVRAYKGSKKVRVKKY